MAAFLERTRVASSGHQRNWLRFVTSWLIAAGISFEPLPATARDAAKNGVRAQHKLQTYPTLNDIYPVACRNTELQSFIQGRLCPKDPRRDVRRLLGGRQPSPVPDLPWSTAVEVQCANRWPPGEPARHSVSRGVRTGCNWNSRVPRRISRVATLPTPAMLTSQRRDSLPSTL